MCMYRDVFIPVFNVVVIERHMFKQETIKEAIEDSITWPVRKVIPILPGDYR